MLDEKLRIICFSEEDGDLIAELCGSSPGTAKDKPQSKEALVASVEYEIPEFLDRFNYVDKLPGLNGNKPGTYANSLRLLISFVAAFQWEKLQLLRKCFTEQCGNSILV